MEKQGIKVDLVDFHNEKQFKASFTKNTKVVWLESPTNPTLKIYDIKQIAKITHDKGAYLVVDNTFFTPFLCNPLELGADVVIHSGTKYLGGHSDVVIGAICTNRKDLFDKYQFIMMSVGSGASPFDCYLTLRGTKTLAVRVQRS